MRFSGKSYKSAIFIVFLGCAGLSSSVSAMQSNQQSNQGAADPGFVCLARDGAGPAGEAVVTRVMVPFEDQEWLEGRGFAVSECSGAKKWLQSTGPSMCSLADIQEPRFLNQFLQMHGLSPSEICQLAKKLPQ